MEKKIKICGVKTIEVVDAAVEAGATHIGLNFFQKSPRYITPAKAAEIAHRIKGKAKIVAVTVDPSDALLNEITSLFKPDYIQLHGNETTVRVKEIKAKFGTGIIKAIAVKEKADLKKAEEYKVITDYIMFDAKAPEGSAMPGGNAISFNWEILKGFKPDYKYILSGGLTSANVKEAIETTGASFVDVSSGVESAPGMKDISLIQAFIRNAKN